MIQLSLVLFLANAQRQQLALKAALSKYPASMDKNERWKAIADDVPGKTKKECIAHVKALKEQLSAQKATAASSS